MKEIKLGTDPLAKALETFYVAHNKHKADLLAAEKAAERSRDSGREANKAWDAVQSLKRDVTVVPVVPIKPREVFEVSPIKVLKPERGWSGGILSLVRP